MPFEFYLSSMSLISMNPATGQTIRSYAEMSAREVEAIVRQADCAFGA